MLSRQCLLPTPPQKKKVKRIIMSILKKSFQVFALVSRNMVFNKEKSCITPKPSVSKINITKKTQSELSTELRWAIVIGISCKFSEFKTKSFWLLYSCEKVSNCTIQSLFSFRVIQIKASRYSELSLINRTRKSEFYNKWTDHSK